MKKLFITAFLIITGLLCADLKAETKEYVATVDSDGIQRAQITAHSYFFEPTHIIVKVNTPVELSVKKEPEIIPHNITLNAPEAGIDFSESLGIDPVTIKFTPTKTGKFILFCNKKPPFAKSHREKGMEGILEVRE